MRTSYIPLAFLVLAETSAVAQPQLTPDNTLALFAGQEVTQMHYFIADADNFATVVLENGENVTWDLSGATIGTPNVFLGRFVAPPFDGLPGGSMAEFASANLALVLDDLSPEDNSYMLQAVEYKAIGESQLLSLGTGMVSAPVGIFPETVVTFDPPKVELPFPTAFGATWQSEHVETTHAGGVSIPGLTTTRSSSVAGAGTVVTPLGTLEALKIDETYVYSALGIEAGHGRSIRFNAPVQQVSGKAGLVWTEIAFELNDNDNVTGGVIIVTQSGEAATASEYTEELPSSIELGQNYPNPFNPSTTIPFTMKRAGQVLLTIHDALGREVTQLVERHLSQGRHEIPWDAGGLPSGVYRAKLTVDGYSQSRPIVLSK